MTKKIAPFCSEIIKNNNKRLSLIMELLAVWGVIFFDDICIRKNSIPKEIVGELLIILVRQESYFYISSNCQLIISKINLYYGKNLLNDLKFFTTIH